MPESVKPESSKQWGGRFSKETDRAVEAFTSSLAVDTRLWRVDIQGSLAHARMLGATGILPEFEARAIVQGLESVREDLEKEGGRVDPSSEDIHSEIEKRLSAKIGPVSGKLHTARSRNDQVATDTRLYLRGEVALLQNDIRSLQSWLVQAAAENLNALMPGLTHMQHAQPVSLGHHLMAYFWMLERDFNRLSDLSVRINVLPLGSAAMAGTSFPLNREMVAKELGFAGITENSLDAVSDRDFVVEFLSAASLLMMHVSRFSEELILWSMPEYGFVTLDDSVTTGSSIMPQKKNPDVAELIRGRVGRVYGDLMGMLTTLKALPLAYNRDLQEDKTFLFDGLDVVRGSVQMMRLMLQSAEFHKERMKQALAGDFSNATDLADYLVRQNLPFRQAHEVVGKVVAACLEQKIALEEISLKELQKFSELFKADVLPVIQHQAVMMARTSAGGTSPAAVQAQIQKAKAILDKKI